MFCRSLFLLLSFFILAILLSVLLRFTNPDYPFGIFKLFLSLPKLSTTWFQFRSMVISNGNGSFPILLVFSFLYHGQDRCRIWAWVTRRVPYKKQELLFLREHLVSTRFCGVRVAHLFLFLALFVFIVCLVPNIAKCV